MKKLWLVCTITAVTVFFGCLVQAEDLANTAAFMNMGFGARSLGMGGVAVATTNDSSAVYHNPAALAFVEDKTLTSGYSRDWAQVGVLNGSINMSGLGVGIMSLQAADVQMLDEFGIPTGTFDFKESVGMIGYGVSFGNSLAVGVTGKYYKQVLSAKSAQGATVDVGALYKQGDFTVGVSARNLLGKVKDSAGNEDPFEREFIIGGAWANNGLVVGIDLNLTGAKRIGAEYDFGLTKVRVGGYLEDGLSFTLGVGVNVDTLAIDYAYLGHSSLSATHRFSAVVKF